MDWLASSILALITLLGHDNYRVREAANAKLRMLADVAIIQLLAGERHPDPEIAYRCRAMVNAWFARHADELTELVKPRKFSDWPFIDMLPIEWPERDGIVHGYLDAVGPADGPGWPRFSRACRLWIRDLIAARVDVGALLVVLCERTVRWCLEHAWEGPPANVRAKVGH